jgi:hypothetical protein
MAGRVQEKRMEDGTLVRVHFQGIRPAAMPSDGEMVARRVRGGHNEAESRRLLTKLRREFSEKNLPAALLHHGFITKRAAESLQLSN